MILLTACATHRTGVAPASAQRPSVSSNTDTTAAGTLEVEAGVVDDPDTSFDVPVTLKYGAGPRTETYVGWSPYRRSDLKHTDGRGPGDTVVGARHRFWDDPDDGLAAAVQGAVKVATGDDDEGLSSGENDLLLAAILDGHLDGWTWTAYYEYGFIGERGDNGYDGQNTLALAAGTHLSHTLSGFAELSSITTPLRFERVVQSLWGVAYSDDPSVIWDLAVSFGHSPDAPTAVIQAGVTVNMGDLVGGG